MAGAKEREQETALLTMMISYFKTLGILLGVWFVGYFGFSAGWVLIGIFGYIVSLRIRQKEDYISVKVEQKIAKNAKAAILAKMEDLPSWVVMPDRERAEWINRIIAQMWPFIGDMVKDILLTTVQSTVEEKLPAKIKPFKFEKIDFGDIAPRIGGMKAYTDNVKRDEFVLDMDLIWASNADIKVSIRGLYAGIMDLQVRGPLRIVFKPLIPVSPLIGGFQAFFLSNPTVDFNLTDLANVADVPGLSDTIRSLVVEQLANQLVMPNKISISLTDQREFKITRLKPTPQGVLRVHVVEAKELKAADFKVMGKGKSDPYAVLKLGTRTFKTKVVNKSLTPVWNNFYDVIIDDCMGQDLDVTVYDDDPGKNDKLGRCLVQLDEVPQKSIVDSWMPLAEVKKGQVHLRLIWLNLSMKKAYLPEAIRAMKVAEGSEDAGMLHSCVLLMNVDSATKLPMTKKGSETVEPSPYATFAIGSNVEKTAIKAKTCDPIFQENFAFLINDPNVQTLEVEVRDSRDKKTNRLLGKTSIRLNSLINEENMTTDQKYVLKQSGPESGITLHLRLRVLTTKSVADEKIQPLDELDAVPLEDEETKAAMAEAPQAAQAQAAPTPKKVKPETVTKSPPKVVQTPAARPEVQRNPPKPAVPLPTTPEKPAAKKPEASPPKPVEPSPPRAIAPVLKPVTPVPPPPITPPTQDVPIKSSPVSISPQIETQVQSRRPQEDSSPSHPEPKHSPHAPKPQAEPKSSPPAPKPQAEPTIGPDAGLGKAQITMRYSPQRTKFAVVIHKCENLKNIEDDGISDPYAKIYILPDKKSKKKTETCKNTLNPVFDESFEFALSQKEMHAKTLKVSFRDQNSVFSKANDHMGQVVIPLAQVTESSTNWFHLQPEEE